MGVGRALTHLDGWLVLVLIRNVSKMESLKLSARLT